MSTYFDSSFPAGFVILAGVFSALLAPARVAHYRPPPAAGQPQIEVSATATAPPISSTPTSTPSPTLPPAASSTAGPETATPTPSPALSATTAPTSTAGPSATASAIPSSTLTLTATPPFTPSPGATGTPSPPATPFPPQALLINELAWAGTFASAADEWIELHNPGPYPIDLHGWRLSDGGDLTVVLEGVLAGYGYYLLERTDDSTVSDLAADQIYHGALSNNGESLRLFDPAGRLIDSANQGGGAWPAGEAGDRLSMERLGGDDRPGNWVSYLGHGGMAHDANGASIPGTPRGANSPFLPTATAPPMSATPTRAPVEPGAVLINEIAWAGTHASAADEWIELHNPGPNFIDLHGWRLSDGGDLDVALEGTLAPYGFFLLERSDDSTIRDLAADQIYQGGLNNRGESLWLRSPDGALIDSANRSGGGWPAGDAATRASMERRGGDDRRGNWADYAGHHGNGLDAAGRPIQGTPRRVNSLHYPAPTPTWIPGEIVINEVLIRPHYDWSKKRGLNTGDEFIELYNRGPLAVNLEGWILDDVASSGSRPFTIGPRILRPGRYAVFFRDRTKIALNDGGDQVRLLAPDGRLIDQLEYLRVRAYNLSYGRLPDGFGHPTYGLWPTPGKANLLFVEPSPTPRRPFEIEVLCPDGGRPVPLLNRLARLPALVSWQRDLGLMACRP